MEKENAIQNFKKMIYQSWTYQRLTTEEKEQLEETFNNTQTRHAIKGNYKQRWTILQAIYRAFLDGVGYTDFTWRETEEVPF